MKVKFDSLNKFEVPQMFLCNPGSVYRDDKTLSGVVGMLHNMSDEEIVFNFNATSELHFRVYDVKVDDPDEYAQILKVYTSLQNRRMIFVEDVGFFIITEVIDGASEGKDYKDITASSCESEIEYKNIPYIEDGTYQFVPLLSSLVEVLPLWTIGEIDSQVSSKYRTFEGVSEDKNVLGFLMEDMQDAYECIFIFDTINRKINVYDQNNFVVQTPIHLTKDDLINTIEIVENSDDLYTAISVLGDENLNITAINPLGTNVIYNFDYYLDWMSEGLKLKVISWQELIKEKFDEYYDLNLEYYNILTQQNDAKYEMQKLQAQITMYTRCKENMVASGNTYVVDSYNELIEGEGGTPITIYPEISDTIESIKELIAQAELEYSKYERQYNAYNTQLEALQVSINNIRNQVAIDKYFTQSEYDELYNYIFEGNYSDDYITVTESMTFAQRFEQMKTLYDRAVIQLEKVSKPTQKFSVGLENFLFVKDFEEWSEQLETGCLLNIELNDNDVAALFLSTIAVNYDDKALDFTFGNRFNKYDPKSLFKDALGNIKKSSNSINYIKDIIYPIKDGKFDEVAEAIRNSRNLTKNAVLASKNEEVLIDEHGYTGRSVDDDGGIDPRQIKITGKNIVFTDDAWDTCDVAIGELILDDGETVYGVNAETIIGNLIFGNQLQIKNVAGTMSFDADGFNVTDGNTSVVIDPSDTSVFKISNKTKGDLLYVGSDGMLNVTGNINAKSLTLGGKSFTGSYKDLSDKPYIPTSFPLPDNVLTTDDVSVGESVSISGGTKRTITVGDESFDMITTDTGDFVLLGNKYSSTATDGSTTYTQISTDGLLQANNAVIYGTLFALNGGKIGNWEIKNYSLTSTKNRDIFFNATHARRVLKHVADIETLTKTQQAKYDAIKDGKITATDARAMLQTASGLQDYYFTSSSTVTINPSDTLKVIQMKYTDPDGNDTESYIGVNGIRTSSVIADTLSLEGNLISAPVLLYKNDSGTSSSFTLYDDIRNYDWIYVIGKAAYSAQNYEATCSAIVYVGNNMNISEKNPLIFSMSATQASNQREFIISSAKYLIFNKTVTVIDNNFTGYYNDGKYGATNYLQCTHVIGFKGSDIKMTI